MVRIIPIVKWDTFEVLQKTGGYRKKLEESWVSGMYDREEGIIYLCDKIITVKVWHPIFFEIKTLIHETLHHIFNLIHCYRFDECIDYINRSFENGIHNWWRITARFI